MYTASSTLATCVSLFALIQSSDAINPALRQATVKGVAIDPKLNRDGCNSVAWADRILWVCHDTTIYANGTNSHFSDSSASYSNMTSTGPPFVNIPANDTVPANEGFDKELLLYDNYDGKPFWLETEYFCRDDPAARCKNGTRFPNWPLLAPIVTSVDEASGNITAYNFIQNVGKKQPQSDDPEYPSTALYQIDWSPSVQGADSDVVPATKLVSPEFYQQGQYAYGAVGTVNLNGTVYLWAPAPTGAAIARVPMSDFGEVSQYEYYVNDAWTSQKPYPSDSTGTIVDCPVGTGGGGVYYSEAWSSFVWIGAQNASAAANGTISISVSPTAEGRWTTPTDIYNVTLGNHQGNPAYSYRVHPDLITDKTSSDMYISYTKNDTPGKQQPLILLEFAES